MANTSAGASSPTSAQSGGFLAPLRRNWSLNVALLLFLALANTLLGIYMLYNYLTLQIDSFNRGESFDLVVPIIYFALSIALWLIVFAIVSHSDWARIPAIVAAAIGGGYLLSTYIAGQVDRLTHNQSYNASTEAAIPLSLSLLFLASAGGLAAGRSLPNRIATIFGTISFVSLILSIVFSFLNNNEMALTSLTVCLAVAAFLMGQAWPRASIIIALTLIALYLTLQIFVHAQDETLVRLMSLATGLASIISVVGLLMLKRWGYGIALVFYVLSFGIGVALLHTAPLMALVITAVMLFILMLLETEPLFGASNS